MVKWLRSNSILIPIVNLEDEIIEHIERSTATENNIYRVLALWLRNSKGEVLLARRSMQKDSNPGKWGPAVSGTVEEGETYEENIRKEMREEIGLIDVPITVGSKIFVQEKWKFFDQWFFASSEKAAEDFVIQKEEVDEVKWFTPEEVQNLIQNTPEELVPSMKTWPKEFIT